MPCIIDVSITEPNSMGLYCHNSVMTLKYDVTMSNYHINSDNRDFNWNVKEPKSSHK